MKSLLGKLGVIIIGLAIFTHGEVWGADSIKEEDKLQKRCGKSAENYFKRFYGSGYYKSSEGTSLYYYTSHYNRELNACFVLLMGKLIPYNTEEMEKYGVTTDKELWDIDANRLNGWFLKINKFKKPVHCEVSGKDCRSESEWDSLVEPYMEE